MEEKKKELASYESEIKKVICGDSVWDAAILNEMILKTKEQIVEIEAECIYAQAALERYVEEAVEKCEQYRL